MNIEVTDKRLNISKWSDTSFSIDPLDKNMPTETFWAGDDYKYIWYLDKAPLNNVIRFKLETSNLKYLYQPPLTEEFTPGWSDEFKCNIGVTETQVIDSKTGLVLVSRPENVVASYAVYHSSKCHFEYTTGKAFHIYRPRLIDAIGQEAYGKILIYKEGYAVEIPEDFLLKAVYPIKSNDTFGVTDVGGSETTHINDDWFGVSGTSGSAGTGDSIKVYAGRINAPNFKGVLCESDLTISTNGVGAGTQLPASASAWTASAFGTSPTIAAATSYYVGMIADGLFNIKYDTESGRSWKDVSNSYASPTDPTDAGNVGDYAYSIYCDYTASAASTWKPRIMMY